MIYHASVMLDEFEERFDEVVAAGFHPEIRIRDAAHLLKLPDADVAQMRERIAARSLTPFTHGPFLGLDIASLDRHIAEYSAGCLARGIEVTAALGGSVMVVHTNYSPRFSRAGLRAWLANWSARMGAGIAKAERLGVRIALENVWEERPDVLARLADAVPGGALAICLDTGHINAFSRLPVRLWWEALAGRVVALHLHDNDGLSDDHEAPGRGTFDFPALVDCLREARVAPLATFEVELAGAIEGRRHIERLFAARG